MPEKANRLNMVRCVGAASRRIWFTCSNVSSYFFLAVGTR